MKILEKVKKIMASISYSTEEKALWGRRRDAIWALCDAIYSRVDHLTTAEMPRKATIQQLLNRLKQFGGTQFKFFDEGFSTSSKIELLPRQNQTEGFSVSYTFGTLIDQISNDLVTIQRAQEQRMSSTAAATLTIADRIAYHALLQVSHLLEQPSTVLTYFHKSPDTRVVPYAPVALVGIPATCYFLHLDPSGTGVLRDLLAIPHELGHHLYWNGSKDTIQNQLRFLPLEQLSNLPDWLRFWLEEIFADSVSCIIGGPIAALSFQDLQSQARNDWLLRDDGVYPVPALRPFIYSEILKQMGMQSAADKLAQRWQKVLENRGLITSIEPAQEHLTFTPFSGEGPILFRLALEQIAAVVGAILPIFEDVNPAERWSSDIGEDVDLTNEEDVEGLYAQFAQQVIHPFLTPEQPVIDFDPQWPERKWYDWVRNRGVQYDNLQSFVVLNRVSIAQDPLITILQNWEEGQLDDLIKLPPENWELILEFAGWSTEGPTDGNLSGG
ncbi:MAG: hypothetical protein R2867_02135 [Caldilineaceae bacterium]